MKKCKDCLNCANCCPVGGGDHVCSEANEEDAFIIEEYVPTDSYMWCNGKHFEEL